jgi:hypothetical protein
MADLQQVSINEPTQDENITLEQQDAMQENAQPTEQTEERPSWLPEKFNSAEDLAKAYGELEQQNSSDEPVAPPTEQPSEPTELGTAIESATTEFMEGGELSDATFETLSKAGLPREFVETYLQGQQAIVDTQSAQVMETVGGQANYQAMSEWASDSLSESELQAFNEVVESGSVEQANMAVRGLYAQYRSAGGEAPSLMQGDTTGNTTKPFNSAAQVTEAMRDPRYKTDPAYRKDVQNRLSVSSAF